MMLSIIKIVAGLILALIIVAFLRTWQVQHSQNQAIFLAGSTPSPLPEDLYKGSVGNYNVSWKGKKFDAANSKGVNIFEGEKERYPFRTSVAKSLMDTIDVLKIDYNLKENPWWIRPILDEIVQTGNNTYFGKIFIRIIPGYPFAIGYFTLTK